MRCPAVAALLALTACDTGSGPAPPMGSRLRLLETIPGAAFRLSVDGRVVNANFHFGTLTPAIVVLPGQHTLSGQSLSDTSSFDWVLAAADSLNYIVFVTDTTGSSGAVIASGVASDSGPGPAAGQAALRVADFSKVAGIEAHFSEVGGAGSVPVSSFFFRAVSDFTDVPPGDWSLVVSHTNMTDTVLLAGPVSVVAGQARTVAVLDSAGGPLTWRLVPDRN
ncbi:MAG: hypothetical protein AUH07_07180 [Gemmatimonadetes bacterium 13_2_20CM_70_9]|nr:MAG: hypothetical protein AUH07_07180 [Gemmatimonadetes bacterium 13_2_20CM_70_9]